MRIMIAVIDHNMHLSRDNKLSKMGNTRGHRKYSKRSQKFHAEVVKVDKSYDYFSFVIARMLKERCDVIGSFTQRTDDNMFNPNSTVELLKGPSRLSKPEAT